MWIYSSAVTVYVQHAKYHSWMTIGPKVEVSKNICSHQVHQRHQVTKHSSQQMLSEVLLSMYTLVVMTVPD